MASKGKRTIHAGGCFGSPLLKVEGKAIAATTPGLLVNKTSLGIGLGATVGAIPLVADFDYLKGLTVDDDWVIDEVMIAIQPQPGELHNFRMGASQTIVYGDALKDSAGADGYLVKATLPADASAVICHADEPVTTGAGDAGTMIRVRFS